MTMFYYFEGHATTMKCGERTKPPPPRNRAAEFRTQSNDALHTVSFTEIHLIYLGNHTNSHKWAPMAPTILVLWVWGKMEVKL